jgi:hypothetical protein
VLHIAALGAVVAALLRLTTWSVAGRPPGRNRRTRKPGRSPEASRTGGSTTTQSRPPLPHPTRGHQVDFEFSEDLKVAAWKSVTQRDEELGELVCVGAVDFFQSDDCGKIVGRERHVDARRAVGAFRGDGDRIRKRTATSRKRKPPEPELETEAPRTGTGNGTRTSQ